MSTSCPLWTSIRGLAACWKDLSYILSACGNFHQVQQEIKSYYHNSTYPRNNHIFININQQRTMLEAGVSDIEVGNCV